ncbi:MAG: hypothetical protein DRN95_09005 [Candidatus Hydrothermarchaeota archaeon]|nr:MAG: hypothetical protein DRN95_09005 [Candidatus Hydrothermarchaeota archaeon]
MIVDGRGCLVSDVKLDVETVTLVNLLGTYGNFRDSDGDGWPDGFEIGCQYQSGDAWGVVEHDGLPCWWGKTIPSNVDPRGLHCDIWIYHITGFAGTPQLFAGGLIKYMTAYPRWDGSVYPACYWAFSVSLGVPYNEVSVGKWYYVHGKMTSDSGFTKEWDNFAMTVSHNESHSNEAYFARPFVYNLTRMGELPRILKDRFNKSRWDELDAEDLAWLLPYVDGVATVGWDWVHGALTPIIELRHGGVL